MHASVPLPYLYFASLVLGGLLLLAALLFGWHGSRRARAGAFAVASFGLAGLVVTALGLATSPALGLGLAAAAAGAGAVAGRAI